ncbi:hypothetical protein OF846_002141 [Rhodotorula toruloides]|nr:hypothetical protein OF846_002141 [Rhodotorula toruloides]
MRSCLASEIVPEPAASSLSSLVSIWAFASLSCDLSMSMTSSSSWIWARRGEIVSFAVLFGLHADICEAQGTEVKRLVGRPVRGKLRRDLLAKRLDAVLEVRLVRLELLDLHVAEHGRLILLGAGKELLAQIVRLPSSGFELFLKRSNLLVALVVEDLVREGRLRLWHAELRQPRLERGALFLLVGKLGAQRSERLLLLGEHSLVVDELLRRVIERILELLELLVALSQLLSQFVEVAVDWPARALVLKLVNPLLGRLELLLHLDELFVASGDVGPERRRLLLEAGDLFAQGVHLVLHVERDIRSSLKQLALELVPFPLDTLKLLPLLQPNLLILCPLRLDFGSRTLDLRLLLLHNPAQLLLQFLHLVRKLGFLLLHLLLRAVELDVLLLELGEKLVRPSLEGREVVRARLARLGEVGLQLVEVGAEDVPLGLDVVQLALEVEHLALQVGRLNRLVRVIAAPDNAVAQTVDLVVLVVKQRIRTLDFLLELADPTCGVLLAQLVAKPVLQAPNLALAMNETLEFFAEHLDSTMLCTFLVLFSNTLRPAPHPRGRDIDADPSRHAHLANRVLEPPRLRLQPLNILCRALQGLDETLVLLGQRAPGPPAEPMSAVPPDGSDVLALWKVVKSFEERSDAKDEESKAKVSGPSGEGEEFRERNEASQLSAKSSRRAERVAAPRTG